jgi:hypothetical protein
MPHTQKKKKSKKPLPVVVFKPKVSSSFTHPGLSAPINSANRIVTDKFRAYSTSSASSVTGGTFVLNRYDYNIANMGTRAVAMGDLFAFYRVVDFKFTGRAHPGGNAVYFMPGNCTWMVGMVFAPVSSYTAPTAMTQMADFPHMHWMQDSPPSKLLLHCGKKEFLNSMPYEWLKTQTTGVNDEDYTQFSLCVASQPQTTNTISSYLDIVAELTIEFRGDMDPAINPKDKLYQLRIPKDRKDSWEPLERKGK